MSALTALEAIRDALTVAGLRVQLLGETVEPPTAVVIPHRIEWNGSTSDPTDGVFGVAVVVNKGDRMIIELLTMVESVAVALELSTFEFVIKAADPSVFGPGNLPAYIFEIEAAL